jgi:peptidoglycan/LPS O-acetylase OafA/YrhL
MSAPARRVLQLDVLRGVAILLVVGRHLELPRPTGLLGALSQVWYTIGWLGVDLFFVLSGFLIGGLLLSEHNRRGRIDVGRFLVRRGLKIYPPYFVFIAYLIAMPAAKAFVGGGDPWLTVAEEATRYWPNLLFVQNYVGHNPAGHTWTLAVEEHFYLMLPFVLVGLAAARRLRWLVPMCLVVVPALLLGVRAISIWAGEPYAVKMAATHLRLDALLFGVGIRAATQFLPERFEALRRWRVPLVAAGVVLWLPNLFLDPSLPIIGTVGLMCTFLGAGAFLIATYHTHAADFGRSRPVVAAAASLLGWIGVYSYAIYLWHVTAIGILEREVGLRVSAIFGTGSQMGWLVSVVLITAGAIIAGVTTARVVEWPVLRLRDRFFPSRSASPSVIASTDSSPQFDGGRVDTPVATVS